jgi:tripeptidyl-peptidase-1
MKTFVSLCILAAASGAPRREMYNRKVFPPTWHLVSRASKFQKMNLIVAVKQQNLAELEKKFWAVSDPKSPEWQKFMSAEEIGAIVKSKDSDMAKVMDWIKSSVSADVKVQKTADAIEVRGSVADAEALFNTEVYSFVHDNGHTILRAMGPHSVPIDVHPAIDFVEGISDFPMHRSSSRKVRKPIGDEPLKDQAVQAMVCPQTLLGLYSVPPDAKVTTVSQGPAEFQDDTSYNKQDLKTFFKQTDLTDETVTDIVGPYDGSQPDTEATLDVQYITSVGQKQVNWYWTSENWMYSFAHNFFNHATVPDAVSISWGWAEDQQCTAGIDQSECQTLGINSEQFVQRVNTEFQKIGLRGVSIFVASGDSGANGRSDGTCTDKKLHASFPGSSPYVTAVGATMLSNPEFKLKNPPAACSAQGAGFECASGGTEVAVSVNEAGFTSGGGFSTYAPMPAYQKKAVAEYLSSGVKLPPSTYYNNTHRGYPDIAAMGNNFLIYMQTFGGWSGVGGTSASTPTVAGIAAYLNDLSYTKKGKPLGFLNPLLYQMHAEAPEAFTDVTVGDNKCTEDGCFPTCKGYLATKGWDPVTGLGTPVADKMLAYVQKLLDSKGELII